MGRLEHAVSQNKVWMHRALSIVSGKRIRQDNKILERMTSRWAEAIFDLGQTVSPIWTATFHKPNAH